MARRRSRPRQWPHRHHVPAEPRGHPVRGDRSGPLRARDPQPGGLSGSLVERLTRCGSTGCRCHADPPQLHGPYLTWTRKVDNKTVTRTLDTAQADALRPLLDNLSRRLRELTTELEALALQQVKDNPTQPHP